MYTCRANLNSIVGLKTSREYQQSSMKTSIEIQFFVYGYRKWGEQNLIKFFIKIKDSVKLKSYKRRA
ncbi:hypothetical protein Bccel_3197 [Pseudobacteroides cellulosolvens ATCC 35603 = DSM 2933]|uniref:Uncharacterized protein n=1 Tax=Pseudobacteroides cellulosolvens ATCC 35603 = DSM 2933 TaxID=398512 RepID=A0A0L6JQ09_9FIRM|nr:hypothetical protein Bccel_3197 [Pseudobacteroides cellulosolvens ATCC 35603 = DSM 2933]